MNNPIYRSTFILLIFNGLSSILLGTMYLFQYLITFRFLGSEIGSESSATSLWASASIGLGVVLLISILKDIRVTQSEKNKISFKIPLLMISINTLIQFPPISLWMMFYILDRNPDQLFGFIVHLIMLVLLIINIYIIARNKGV